MVVDDKLGVVKEFPVPKLVPPVATVYQLIVPELAVAPSVTVPLSHLDAGVVLVIVGIVPVPTVKVVLTELEQEDPEVSV